MTGYAAREIPGNSGAIVLAPDGLTWESDHPTLEAAQAYALALNEWSARKPDAANVAPFFAPVELELEPTGRELELAFEAILERGSRAERMHVR